MTDDRVLRAVLDAFRVGWRIVGITPAGNWILRRHGVEVFCPIPAGWVLPS